MPLFQMDSEKFLAGEYWSNRYFVNIADVSSGAAVADAIVAAERKITIPDVTITRVRISDGVEGTDVFAIRTYNLQGTRVVLTQALPLFCTARFDFDTGVGRPSRKYMRGVLAEGDQTNYGVLEPTTVTSLASDFVVDMLAISEYVDVDGQSFVSGTVYSRVQMRQLRRGSRRTPIV